MKKKVFEVIGPVTVKFTTVFDHAVVNPVPTVSVTLALASYDPAGKSNIRLIWLAASSAGVMVWTGSETRVDQLPPVACTCSSILSPAPIVLSTSMVKTAFHVADTKIRTGALGVPVNDIAGLAPFGLVTITG
jgi:hypothetical protein